MSDVVLRVAAYKGPEGLFGNLIRFWTWSRYSHVELVFPDGVWFSSDPNGSMLTRFANYGNTINPEFWDVVEIPVSFAEEKIVRQFCETEIGCRYDWWGILCSQILPFGWQSASKWFCSEVLARAVQSIGYLLGVRPCRFSPGRLVSSLIKALKG